MTATLTKAIQWIADNDETGETDSKVMAELISVMLVADLFDKSPAYIARRVLLVRQDQERADSLGSPERLARGWIA